MCNPKGLFIFFLSVLSFTEHSRHDLKIPPTSVVHPECYLPLNKKIKNTYTCVYLQIVEYATHAITENKRVC